jgi:hypothetical protein
MRKIILAAALVLTATTAALAQYSAPGYGYYGAPRGYYDAAPGYGYYGVAPGYGYYDNDASSPAWSNDTLRGGPGPRVGAGSGAGIGSQR